MRLKIPENVVFQVLDGQAVVLNLDSGYYFGLNEVGTRFWQRLGETGSLEAIVEDLLGEFEVERSVLEEDMVALIEDLKTRKLVEEVAADG